MNEILSQNLKAYRTAHNLTQDELADIIKKDRSLIAKYESGKTVPPISVLNALASLYNTSVDVLCGNSGNSGTVIIRDPESEKPVLQYENLTKEEQMLILKLRMLGDNRIGKVIEKVDRELNKKDIYK